MERYRDMQLFAALAEQPSLASAARAAQVSAPTLMRAIARLEARLRVPLLQRSTRGVSLTDTGTAYMADCVRLLAAVDAAEASAKGLHVQVQGNLRVFMPLLFSRYVMAPLLASYMDRYPAVQLTAHDALGAPVHRRAVDHAAAFCDELAQHLLQLLTHGSVAADIERLIGAQPDHRDLLAARRDGALDRSACCRRLLRRNILRHHRYSYTGYGLDH